MKNPCPASKSGMCLSMVEGFEPCSIDDDYCDYSDLRIVEFKPVDEKEDEW